MFVCDPLLGTVLISQLQKQPGLQPSQYDLLLGGPDISTKNRKLLASFTVYSAYCCVPLLCCQGLVICVDNLSQTLMGARQEIISYTPLYLTNNQLRIIILHSASWSSLCSAMCYFHLGMLLICEVGGSWYLLKSTNVFYDVIENIHCQGLLEAAASHTETRDTSSNRRVRRITLSAIVPFNNKGILDSRRNIQMRSND